MTTIRKRLWRVISTPVMLVAFILPVYAFVAAKSAGLPPRQQPPIVNVQTVPVVNIPSYNTVVPMLEYHDISDTPGRYTVTPERFAYQMAVLHRAGYHTLSAAQMLGFVHEHQPLPDRPIMIAFDDGLGSAWRTADPILAQYHFHAVVFMSKHTVHGYYYLHPEEVQSMIKSGRWDIENHTDINQYYKQNLVYKIRLYQDSRAKGLLKTLILVTPIPVGLDHMPFIWVVMDKSKKHHLLRTANGVLTLHPRVKHWLQVVWAPHRTAHWQNYTVNVNVGNLGTEGSGASATLIVAKYTVTISAGRLSSVVNKHHWKALTIPEAPQHQLSVTMTRQFKVTLDGKEIINVQRIPYTFGGISFGAWRTNARSLNPTFQNLSVTNAG